MESFIFRNVTYSYPKQDRNAVENISFSLRKGSFTVVCGPSGCGKTTLLKLFKSCLITGGRLSGDILFNGRPLKEADDRTQAEKIGFVFQSPFSQCVSNTVSGELAFGLENLGLDSGRIRRRIAETASFFGIGPWLHKNISELSGGQRQLLGLAAAACAEPDILVLDEPSAQLDPIAAERFFSVLDKINRELGTTVILSEHRLERVMPSASEVIIMENGKILDFAAPAEAGRFLKESGNAMLSAMPAAVRIWAGLDSCLPCPVSAREGSAFLSEFAKTHKLLPVKKFTAAPRSEETVLEAEEISFRYPDSDRDIIKDMSFTLKKGEIYALIGGNGSGKSTALKILAGIYKPRSGSIRIKGKTAYLPQLTDALFSKETVGQELEDILRRSALTPPEQKREYQKITELCELNLLKDRHPFDISEGEKQRAALGMILLTKPGILLLDEPTKGCGALFGKKFAEIIKRLSDDGISIIIVSHDIDLCAENAGRCGMLFDGRLAAQGEPADFFRDNIFYTTSAHITARSLIPDAITVGQVIACCGGKAENTKSEPEKTEFTSKQAEPGAVKPQSKKIKKLPLAFALSAAASFLYMAYKTDLQQLSHGLPAKLPPDSFIACSIFIISLFALSTAAGGGKSRTARIKSEKKRLSKKSLTAISVSVLSVPLTIAAGLFLLGKNSFGLISAAVLLESMLPFFIAFEGGKPPAKDISAIAVLCAAAIAGRAALFMLPQVKPVAAIAVIAGAAFGAEAGFMTGSISMLLSNIIFSWGPWTPWQMFCMGLCGLLAGVLVQTGAISANRFSLAFFGAASALLIYGGIMNFSSAVMFGGAALNAQTLLGFYITGLPMDIIHAASTFVFLAAGSESLLKTLNRLKIKYGLFGF